MVTDINHLLDLADDAPAAATRLAEFLGDVVRAGSAGDVGAGWTTALPCRRRPGNRPCAGRLVVRRVEQEADIGWRCSACGDDGVITHWAGSPFDLRPGAGLAVVDPGSEVRIDQETAAVLRHVLMVDPDCDRVVFRIRTRRGGGAVLTATADELEQLLEAVAAEANHAPNRRTQRRFDDAFEQLSDAAGVLAGW